VVLVVVLDRVLDSVTPDTDTITFPALFGEDQSTLVTVPQTTEFKTPVGQILHARAGVESFRPTVTAEGQEFKISKLARNAENEQNLSAVPTVFQIREKMLPEE